MLTEREYWSNYITLHYSHLADALIQSDVMLTDGEYWSNAHRWGVLE